MIDVFDVEVRRYPIIPIKLDGNIMLSLLYDSTGAEIVKRGKSRWLVAVHCCSWRFEQYKSEFNFRELKGKAKNEPR